MQRNMDNNHNNQDETTSFEATFGDGDGKSFVSTSGISSSPQIDTSNTNTLSWGINECSSSFRSVSSSSLDSYEPENEEAPNVIVVPFLADNQVTGTMIANNGVHIPLLKECSIRIDPLKMTSEQSDGIDVGSVIELPFSTDTAASEVNTKPPSVEHSDDESSPFLGFEVESTNGALCELYRKAVQLIKENAARAAHDRSGYSSKTIPTTWDTSETILTERILTERHFMERQPPGRNIKSETVKRPRQIQRKITKQRLSDDQMATQNQSRTETTAKTEVNLSSSPRKENNVMKPVVPTPERVSFLPAQDVDDKTLETFTVLDSSESDTDAIPTPVTPAVSTDNSATKKKQERSPDIKNNSKEKEQRKLEKMRRNKEFSWIAQRIYEHWMERLADIKKEMRKKEAKKRESDRNRSHSTQYANNYRHRKNKRVSYSSDTDSTDSSSSSRTSCSSSSSDSDSDPDTYTSDTSYTSQTTHTKSESDSSDSDSDSSNQRYRSRRRLNKRRRPPSESSETSETSSSDDDDSEPGRYVKQRNFQSVKREHRRPSTCDESHTSSRKRKATESHRSEGLSHQKQRKIRKISYVEEDEPRRVENRTESKRRQHRFDYPSTSTFMPSPPTKVEKDCKKESTSAGDFFVE